jgi:exopolysaccharide biosynthesis protein
MITLSDISGTSWHGKMLIVRDPKLVTLAIPEPVGNGAYGSFMQVEDFVELYGAVAGITAGGFYMEEGLPFGIIIKDGKVVSSVDGERGGIIGFTKEHKLVLGYMTKEQAAEKGIVEAICWQPYLILNGIKQTDLGGGYNPRAAIGQRADGAIVLVLIEGRMVSSLGATYDDLADFMEAQGCINAANLDSGRSSVMVYEGKQITKVAVGAGIQTVDRLIPNAFVVMPEGWTEDD